MKINELTLAQCFSKLDEIDEREQKESYMEIEKDSINKYEEVVEKNTIINRTLKLIRENKDYTYEVNNMSVTIKSSEGEGIPLYEFTFSETQCPYISIN